jgi:hypothetical protein
MTRLSALPRLLVSCSALLPVLVVACGGPPPPATPSSDGPTAGATPSAQSAPSAAATGPSAVATGATGATAATSTATSATESGKPTTPAPATSRGLETAIQQKTTSAGGSYAVGTVSATGIAEADVVQVLNAAAAKTDGCYVPLFKKQLGAKGATSFEVEIDAEGKTKSVSAKANELKDGALVSCLEGVLKKLTWPTPTKAPAKTTVAWVVSGN